MPIDGRLIFKSRRKALPPLILDLRMQHAAFLADWDDAIRNLDMRAVHHAEISARKVLLRILGRKHA